MVTTIQMHILILDDRLLFLSISSGETGVRWNEGRSGGSKEVHPVRKKY